MDKKILKQLKELEKLGIKMRLAAEEWDKPWKILIATIMSARTRDEVTIPVAEKLFNKYYTIEKLSKAKLSDIAKIIKPVNFYKNKSKNVLNCAKILNEKYKGEVPLSIEELIELPGVGRKTANVFLSEIGKLGLGIDTHVHYISNFLGWSKNKNPHKVEEDLKRLFPKKYWISVNPILVRFGKTYTSRKQKNELLEKIKKII
ncbi:endonuclease III [Candidatus Woesearchaeota archaeon]|nr:endonuclease III [Candidatus Woesearchaeota archaeon]